MSSVAWVYIIGVFAVSARVAYAARKSGNPRSTSAALGTLFGLFWPLTIVIWAMDKLDDFDS